MDPKNKANFINQIADAQPVEKSAENVPAFSAVATEDAPVHAEPVSIFAEGLPAWDIVPPQVVVRRR